MSLTRDFYTRPFAHRALHDVATGRPENSPAAVRAAIAGGYGVEIDLQLSADGVAMVFHDYALDRLTGESGPVRQRPAAALAEMTLNGGDEGVPTLAKVLEIVAGRMPMLIELKDQDGAMGPDIGALEQATVHALAGYDGPVALMSFNPHSVALLAELAPDIPRGLVTSAYEPADWPLPRAVCDRLRDIPDYDRTGACFISHEVSDLARPRVAALKARGAMVCCWTVRSAEEEARARQIAHNITFEGYRA